PESIAALVEPDQVHRDVYIDPQVFELELRHLWGDGWIYVGHDSQVPRPGDTVSARIAGSSTVAMRRDHDGGVRVTGSATQGGGAEPGFVSASYRGFVFAHCGAAAPAPAQAAEALASDFGDMLAVLDNVADRSPLGRLEIAGGCVRTLVRANWKIYVENINDTVHPPVTHESSSAAAVAVWSAQPPDADKPMAMQQLLPFGSGWDFFESMGARALRNGHTILGTRSSIHAGYAGMPGYEPALRAAHGDERARQVLSFAPQNAVFFPSLSVKASPPAIRVIRPLAVDRTLIEAWSLRPAGAPDALLQRATMYNRLVFSPMSVVAHDDLHVFESIQRALPARGNPWVSLHRGHDPAERDADARDAGGTSELLMRNHYRAWARRITESMRRSAR
ncbi:MAG TPA: aromatic ring-hydroxylating dioxygenase subunit alpha, partial [Burkholderiaceae bacterium]|nr:aromatic ring-hydroxylating dioxygenase subunit alpha [Burkholderiaceae bacterium]